MSDPLPPELREELANTPVKTEYEIVEPDNAPTYFLDKDSVNKVLQLFDAEYQRRIKSAKPAKDFLDESRGVYSPEYHREVDGYNKAIDQYEHNLKQLSEGERASEDKDTL